MAQILEGLWIYTFRNVTFYSQTVLTNTGTEQHSTLSPPGVTGVEIVSVIEKRLFLSQQHLDSPS